MMSRMIVVLSLVLVATACSSGVVTTLVVTATPEPTSTEVQQPEPTVSPTTEVQPGLQPDEIAAIISTIAREQDWPALRPYVTPESTVLPELPFERAMGNSIWTNATTPEEWTVQVTTAGFTIAHPNKFPFYHVFKLVDGEWKFEPNPRGLTGAYYALDGGIAVNGPLLESEIQRQVEGEEPPGFQSVRERNIFTRLDPDRFVYAAELEARTEFSAQIDFNEVYWVIDGRVEPVTLVWAAGVETTPRVFEYPAFPDSTFWSTEVMFGTSGPVAEGTEMTLHFGGITVGEGENAYTVTIDRTFKAATVRVPKSLSGPMPDQLAAMVSTFVSEADFRAIKPYVTHEFAALPDKAFEQGLRAGELWAHATEINDWTYQFTSQRFAIAHLDEFPLVGFVFKQVDGDWRFDPGPLALFEAYGAIDEAAVDGPMLESEADIGIESHAPSGGEPQELPMFTRLDQDRLVYATELSANTDLPVLIDFGKIWWLIEGRLEQATVLWISGDEHPARMFEYPARPDGSSWRTWLMLATPEYIAEGTEMTLRLGGITIGEGDEAYTTTIIRRFKAGNVRVPEF